MICGRALGCLGLALSLMLVGCGTEKPSFPSATVHGVATIDGTPVKEGSLQFIPDAGVKGQVAQAQIADGKYTAKNVPIGKVRVMFSVTRKTGKMITEYSTPYPEIENLVPDQYRDGMELTVTGDDNVPFDLVSKPEEKK